MRFALIADNRDTLTGLRLAGIDGVIAHTQEETISALDRFCGDPDVGILLITEKLAALCPQRIYQLKLNASTPLVVEIPDRHGTGRRPDSITRFVQEAIGIKM